MIRCGCRGARCRGLHAAAARRLRRGASPREQGAARRRGVTKHRRLHLGADAAASAERPWRRRGGGGDAGSAARRWGAHQRAGRAWPHAAAPRGVARPLRPRALARRRGRISERARRAGPLPALARGTLRGGAARRAANQRRAAPRPPARHLRAAAVAPRPPRRRVPDLRGGLLDLAPPPPLPPLRTHRLRLVLLAPARPPKVWSLEAGACLHRVRRRALIARHASAARHAGLRRCL
mmetsp:Transcript_14944/g.47996  ORF Transcript_14944/g.47996 Transcript_14944/m.47996 type:complete len:237 (+) Transcript_14944:462-1172(+)